MNRDSVKISQNVAAAIAHEMRNPLLGIASAAQLIRYRIGDDPVMEKNVGRIIRESERLNALISALLEYARPAPVSLEPADPDDIWHSVLEHHRGELESKALLVQHTAAEPRATCNLDAQQFAQACGNALANAIDASAEGGDLTIVSTVASDGTWQSELHNGGLAIAPDTLAHAFEPLVTTKPGHAGIGLATAHRIVSEHGGSISLDSSEPAGTTLTFMLPAARLP